MAEPLKAGLVARIWPPDCFPDAHPPDRLTVKGRGGPSEARAAAPSERSDPLTVRPEGVGGDRLLTGSERSEVHQEERSDDQAERSEVQ